MEKIARGSGSKDASLERVGFVAWFHDARHDERIVGRTEWQLPPPRCRVGDVARPECECDGGREQHGAGQEEPKKKSKIEDGCELGQCGSH